MKPNLKLRRNINNPQRFHKGLPLTLKFFQEIALGKKDECLKKMIIIEFFNISLKLIIIVL